MGICDGGLTSRDLFVVVATVAVLRLPELNAQELANVAQAFAMVELFTALVNAAKRWVRSSMGRTSPTWHRHLLR